jgi:glyoxylase-like metal-dependent hydrolase (beta-lactamase superfamily II)
VIDDPGSGEDGLIQIDLDHLGLAGAIAAYVLPGDAPIVVDPGPSTTLPTLERKLAELGLRLEDLRHVVLTHVHLDHAGASGHLVKRVPKLTVHVHQEGAPHMADPERLVASTRRTFGEAHDRLWGEVLPIPSDRIRAWEPGARGSLRRSFRAIPTPGHIGHHLAWLDEVDGSLYAGDSMGIILEATGPTHPPTPPPAIDLRAWHESLERLRGIAPERAAVTHFGVHSDFDARRRALDERLEALESRVRSALQRGDESDPRAYEEDVRAELAEHLPRERVDRYFDVFPAATDWAGVRRYLEKQEPKKAG